MGVGTTRRIPNRWIVALLFEVLGWGWLWMALGLAAPADEIVPIGSITINPMANNRRAVILQGKVRGTVDTYEGQDNFGRAICGQGFVLEDETGSLDVLYLIRCQTTDTLVLVREDERVVVQATIDVTSDNIKNTEGRELVFKAMATKIIRGK